MILTKHIIGKVWVSRFHILYFVMGVRLGDECIHLCVLFRYMALILCQIWIKTHFVKYLFFIKRKKIYITGHFIYSKFKHRTFLYFHVWNDFTSATICWLSSLKREQPLYLKAFMNYNNLTLNSARSSLFSKRGVTWKMTNMKMYLKYFTLPYVIPNLKAVNYFAHIISKAVFFFVCLFSEKLFCMIFRHLLPSRGTEL